MSVLLKFAGSIDGVNTAIGLVVMYGVYALMGKKPVDRIATANYPKRAEQSARFFCG